MDNIGGRNQKDEKTLVFIFLDIISPFYLYERPVFRFCKKKKNSCVNAFFMLLLSKEYFAESCLEQTCFVGKKKDNLVELEQLNKPKRLTVIGASFEVYLIQHKFFILLLLKKGSVLSIDATLNLFKKKKKEINDIDKVGNGIIFVQQSKALDGYAHKLVKVPTPII
ncbi:hypothetical protein RFI_22496 [Reticulomyxa filosa]|uniref:Uncharacterized protein n=1 Tax=Reticulomyxa filosa TaxID=46433 RepID=X6MNA1_RETFI|nr:hypothetical protein RFI_22496 [Reticulomyxa filosa]|eukprot:ETO14872.1 hypothetical protein RFI_22496 [Reticulomyxa filosa]